MNYKEVVRQANDLIYEQGYYEQTFSYYMDSNLEGISFWNGCNEIRLWNSEDDECRYTFEKDYEARWDEENDDICDHVDYAEYSEAYMIEWLFRNIKVIGQMFMSIGDLV